MKRPKQVNGIMPFACFLYGEIRAAERDFISRVAWESGMF